MIILDLCRYIYIHHKQKLILKQNSSYSTHKPEYRYIVVDLTKRKCIRAFRTLKEAKLYLGKIKTFYERKNMDVYMAEHSRSIVISNVAQYIKEECNKKWCNIYTIYPLLLKKDRGERRKRRVKNY